MAPPFARTLAAAAHRLANASRDTWTLADAILADVPEMTQGARNLASAEARLAPQLTALAAALADAEITTPTGDHYTSDGLRQLRQTAIDWPEAERQGEAAYRTHREAGAAPQPRGAFLALCAFARGEDDTCPPGVDAVAWADAIKRVADRTRGFPVTSNDVRVALGRLTNVPGRGTPAPTADAIADTLAADPALARQVIERAVQAPEVRRHVQDAAFQADLADMETEERALFAEKGWHYPEPGEVAPPAISAFHELAVLSAHACNDLARFGRLYEAADADADPRRHLDAVGRDVLAHELERLIGMAELLKAAVEGAPADLSSLFAEEEGR